MATKKKRRVTFHGAFNTKADAVRKEKTVPGSFVRRKKISKGPQKGQVRYFVIRPEK